MSEDRLKIIFINYGVYAGCSGVHIHFLANTLVAMGHECSVFLYRTDGSDDYFGETNYPIYSFRDISTLPIEHFENAIIHVWTTRELARIPTAMLRQRIKLPYLVHLEDNEILISGKELGVYTLEEQKALVKEQPELLEKLACTNPLFFESFMRASSGVTCIIKKLEEFVPEGVPRMTFWPACEDVFFQLSRQRNLKLRKSCDIDEETFVLVYPGAIHEFNGVYFVALLRAVEQLSAEGFSLRIIRCGIEDYFYDDELLELYGKHVVFMGNVKASELPQLIAFADILVQPGAPRSFDDYRFPSKAPYFLASGRPVILPQTNVAEKLQHGRDCFLLKKGDADEIAKYLRMLMTHPELAESIGAQGRATARALFSWEKAAQSLIPFYKNALLNHKT